MFHNDFETRSRADLRRVGAYRYAEDPSTEALMLAIARNRGEPVLWINPRHGWSIDQDEASELLRAQLVCDEEIYAHNYEFEKTIWANRGRPDLRQPAPDSKRWRCTAAMARVAALPWSLKALGEILELDLKKSKEGEQLIRFFSIPDKDGKFREPRDHSLAFARFGAYCVQDVRVEQRGHERLKAFELTGDLLATFQMDGQVNDRGIPINRVALQNAVKILDDAVERGLAQFVKITGLSPTQREKVRQKLYDMGLALPDMTAETVKRALEAESLHCGGRELLQSYQLLQFAAVKKVKTMLDCACSDDRLRGMLLFFGAIRSGRWAGRIVQPQNMKTPKHKQSGLVMEMVQCGRSAEEIELIFPNAVEEISNCIRHMIPGPLFHADFAAIEARGICWLAGQDDVLQMFRDGLELYCIMAERIYKVKVDKKKDPEKRQVGKVTFLGCGYQMGPPRFLDDCLAKGIPMTLPLANVCVESYRSLCWKVKQLWWTMDKAVRTAILTDKTIQVGPHLTVRRETKAGIPYLLIDLPTGRSLHYPWPKIEDGNITFYGKMDTGSDRWGRIKTYGGKLCENANQAICTADLTAHGAKVAIAKGYPVFTLTHDDAMAEKRPGLSAEEFGRLLATPPPWAAGLPIKAEAHELKYYTKV